MSGYKDFRSALRRSAAKSRKTRILEGTSRGRPNDADVTAFLAAGYSERNILGIVLAIGIKTYSNYTNHVVHTPVDGAFASRLWEAA